MDAATATGVSITGTCSIETTTGKEMMLFASVKKKWETPLAFILKNLMKGKKKSSECLPSQGTPLASVLA